MQIGIASYFPGHIFDQFGRFQQFIGDCVSYQQYKVLKVGIGNPGTGSFTDNFLELGYYFVSSLMMPVRHRCSPVNLIMETL